MKKFALGIIDIIIGWLNDFDVKIDGCADILREDIMVSSNHMFVIVHAISQMLIPTALTIVGICFLVEFLKITVKMDVLKWEFMLRVLVLLAISQAVITAAPMFMSAIYASSADMVTTAMGAGGCTIGTTAGNALFNEANQEGKSWGDILSLALSMLIPSFAIQACTILIKVMAYARMFELLIYIAAAPIPCAFLPLENSHMTKKFFISFAAVCIQGLFMIICIKLFGALATSTLTDDSLTQGDSMFNLLIGSLLLVMSIIKTGQWSKQILDAN
ncbi:MAG: hypothetical protein RR540_00145 [Oscillospiraceae bacterium]